VKTRALKKLYSNKTFGYKEMERIVHYPQTEKTDLTLIINLRFAASMKVI